MMMRLYSRAQIFSSGGLAAPRRAASTSSSGLSGLEPYLKGSAGYAGARAPYLSYIDSLRADALMRARMHLGHARRRTHPHVTGQLAGFRHNVAIFDVAKTWRSMRTLFHAFAEMAAARSSFFLLATNPNLPLGALAERMRAQYPFRTDRFTSLYMTGYADKKWINGLFSNWRVMGAYAAAVQNAIASNSGADRYKRVAATLKGVADADAYSALLPDFVLVLAPHRAAMREARNADVPLVGLVDSDTDPRQFLYPVFANDDSIESAQFLLDLIVRGIQEGRRREQEAFALLLIRKVKQHLDPASGTASALLTPPDAAASGFSLDSSDDPWLPQLDDSASRPQWLTDLNAETAKIKLHHVRAPAK
jgi:small subunit ribosomal protein S2